MNFNQMMIHFCAPTFCNIKPGNLFFVQNKIFSKSSFEAWKKDFAADEAGLLPQGLKRGVLSEDGIYNILQIYSERTEQDPEEPRLL